MSVEKTEVEVSQWFSTYGLITAERILGRYQIKLAQSDLISAVKNPFNFYHQLLDVPLKSVLNGIVLQQANDYHVYAQKLFIDYLLSGETSKSEESQGASIREELEQERTQLVSLGEEYHQQEEQHNNLIAKSQALLIKMTREFNVALEKAISATATTLKQLKLVDARSKVRQAINYALIVCDMNNLQLQNDRFLFIEKINEVLKVNLNTELKEKMVVNLSVMLDLVFSIKEQIGPFVEQADDLGIKANSFRSQFYDTVLRILELIKLLPEYKIDPVQDTINREPLYFDKNIGVQEGV